MNNSILPTQTEVEDYVETLLKENPTESFYITYLTLKVIEGLKVSEQAASLQCEIAKPRVQSDLTEDPDHSTRIEQLTHFAAIHLLDRGSIKRVGHQIYQDVTGALPVYVPKRVAERELKNLKAELLALMKHARKIGFSQTEAFSMFLEGRSHDLLAEAAVIAYSA